MNKMLMEITEYNIEKYNILNMMQDIDMINGTDNDEYKTLADVYECIDSIINNMLSELSDEEKLSIYEKSIGYTKESLIQIFNIKEDSIDRHIIEKAYTKSLNDLFNSVEIDLVFKKIIDQIHEKNKLIENHMVYLNQVTEKNKKTRELLINTKYEIIYTNSKVERLMVDSLFKDINYESNDVKSKELQFFSLLNSKLR